MAWRRLGLLYGPDGSKPWSVAYAALPVPVNLDGDRFRFFFSTRDAENRSSIGWVDVDLSDKPRVLAECREPVIRFGPDGQFDDSGIGLGSIVGTGQDARLYFMGWNLSVRSPWHNSIGVAIGDPRVPQFVRLYKGPIMDRTPEDPYTLSYPWVVKLSDDDWRMWYGSSLTWGAKPEDMQHLIKVAHSTDGLQWRRTTEAAIDFQEPNDYVVIRPTVLVEERGRFRAWFATRGARYRIGAATSDDGEHWTRCDAEAGLQTSPEGWDDDMVCYPCVFRHHDQLYLAYNGNRYGREGFGLACWEG